MPLSSVASLWEKGKDRWFLPSGAAQRNKSDVCRASVLVPGMQSELTAKVIIVVILPGHSKVQFSGCQQHLSSLPSEGAPGDMAENKLNNVSILRILPLSSGKDSHC